MIIVVVVGFVIYCYWFTDHKLDILIVVIVMATVVANGINQCFIPAFRHTITYVLILDK